MSLWKSNLILSDIPWDYYLHPCPKFYGWELAKHGVTLWINPPSKNPFKFRLKRPAKNLVVLTPWMLKRPVDGLGFDRREVRLQIKLVARTLLKKVSSIWSVSTAYKYLLEDFPLARSIFWSGDFFDPLSEFTSYKEFDLVLCLTPPKYKRVPDSYKGKKIHFNMSCDLNIFKEDSNEHKFCESFAKFITNSSKTVGYIGTLSSRRINYTLIKRLLEICPSMNFVFIGKRDGLRSTDYEVESINKQDNVLILENVEYVKIPHYLNHFDVCLIPYNLDEANLGTCPNKFVEYCAVGKPVVSTRLPGLTKFAKLASFGASAEDFSLLFVELLDNKREEQIKLQKKFAEQSSASSFLTEIEKLLQIN